jgi:hypothetical protein
VLFTPKRDLGFPYAKALCQFRFGRRPLKFNRKAAKGVNKTSTLPGSKSLDSKLTNCAQCADQGIKAAVELSLVSYFDEREQQFRSAAAIKRCLENVFKFFKQMGIDLEAADDFASLFEKGWSTYSYGHPPVCQEANSSILARNSASKNPATVRKLAFEGRGLVWHWSILPQRQTRREILRFRKTCYWLWY